MVADATVLVQSTTILCRDDSARGGALDRVSSFAGTSDVVSADWPPTKIDGVAKIQKAGFSHKTAVSEPSRSKSSHVTSISAVGAGECKVTFWRFKHGYGR
jgi:hypothetical protein